MLTVVFISSTLRMLLMLCRWKKEERQTLCKRNKLYIYVIVHVSLVRLSIVCMYMYVSKLEIVVFININLLSNGKNQSLFSG